LSVRTVTQAGVPAADPWGAIEVVFDALLGTIAYPSTSDFAGWKAPRRWASRTGGPAGSYEIEVIRGQLDRDRLRTVMPEMRHGKVEPNATTVDFIVGSHNGRFHRRFT